MDSLQQIIGTLNADDRLNFKRFLKRTKGNDNRKDLQLFSLVVSGIISNQQWCMELYDTPNDARYQALRKRLTTSLNRFIALKLIDSDSSDASMVLSLVNMARYLSSHGLQSLAIRYLEKAEKAALKNDLYEILNSIYVLHIQQLTPNESIKQQRLINKWQENKTKLELNEKGEIALSIVSKKIQQALQTGHYADIESILAQTLDELNLSAQFLLQPRFVYTLAQVNRHKMLVVKDFFHLEPFLIKQYELIANNKGFGSKYNYYKLGFLYMIAHILYRNKKFKQAISFLSQLEGALEQSSKTQQKEFYPKAVLLKANLLLFTNKLADAITLLEQVQKKEANLWTTKLQLNLAVNVGILHFQNGRYKKTLKALNTIEHSDAWCIKKMGREWVLKKALMEVLLYIELEEDSLVDSRLRFVQRSFRDLFDLPLYARVKRFIQFVKLIAKHPNSQELKLLKEELEHSFDWVPLEYEDLQAVGFYAWLKARLNKQSSYEVLLALVNSE